ncbi:hypothetical protein D3C80_994940 [compost metagenome]
MHPFYHKRLTYKTVLGIDHIFTTHIILVMLLDHPTVLIVIIHRPEEIGATQYIYLRTG